MRSRLLLCLVATAGCWSSGPKARVEGAVQVFDAPPDFDTEAFQDQLRADVMKMEGIGSDGAPVQLIADFGRRVRMVEDQAVTEWVLQVGFRPLAGATEKHAVAATVAGPSLETLTSSAAEGFAVRWSMRRASDREVLRCLDGADEAAWQAAAEEAGRRRLRRAVESLAERLGRERTSDEAALALVEALVAIGDPAAAPALIDATDRESPLLWPPVLFGLSKLGGRQAEGFLFTVAQGHPNPDVQRRARLALDEMARTEESPSE